MITEEKKQEFINIVKAQIEFYQKANKMYYEDTELYKVLIDINLEHIEQLEMLIGES